jgi:hypothetical protein
MLIEAQVKPLVTSFLNALSVGQAGPAVENIKKIADMSLHAKHRNSVLEELVSTMLEGEQKGEIEKQLRRLEWSNPRALCARPVHAYLLITLMRVMPGEDGLSAKDILSFGHRDTTMVLAMLDEATGLASTDSDLLCSAAKALAQLVEPHTHFAGDADGQADGGAGRSSSSSSNFGPSLQDFSYVLSHCMASSMQLDVLPNIAKRCSDALSKATVVVLPPARNGGGGGASIACAASNACTFFLSFLINLHTYCDKGGQAPYAWQDVLAESKVVSNLGTPGLALSLSLSLSLFVSFSVWLQN